MSFQFPSISGTFGEQENLQLPSISLALGTGINPSLHADKAGFFGSLFSAATREQIGMLPSPEVQRYRNENPVKGFTSMALPEIALFSLPATKIGAIAVRSLRPAMALLRYGKTARAGGHAFWAGAAEITGQTLPIFAARQAASLFAPEEGSFSRIAERNAYDILFGGAFGGTAEFLRGLREARIPSLRPGQKEPEHSVATVWKYFQKEVDLNNPPQDQLATMLRLGEQNPASPVLADIRRAAELMRAEVLTQEPHPRRPFVTKLGHRKSNSILNALFRAGKPLTEVGDEFAIKNILPKDFEAFSKFPRAIEIGPSSERAKVWTDLMDNLERVDNNTFVGQEGSEGLFVLVKKVNSQEAGKNRLFVGTPEIPDRYILLKTSKPWEFVDRGTTSARTMEDIFSYDPHYTRVSDNGFLDSRMRAPGSKTIQLAEGVEASVLPGNTPTLAALDREIALAKPWQKGLYGVAESTGQLETPSFLKRGLDKLSATAPVTVPYTGHLGIPKVVKDFSTEAGHLIREAAQALRPALAPATAQFGLNARAAVINRLSSQAFHRMLGRTRQLLWGEIPDKALVGNLVKNLFLRRHDPRVGGILSKAVQVLNSPERLAQFTPAWRFNWSPEEALQKGLGSEIVDFLRELKKFDFAQVVELKAQRAALGLEDDFVPLENYYAMSRMWEGNFRVELYDDLTGDVVGYAGGKRPAEAMDNARAIVAEVNLAGPGKLRAPIPEHMSTTEFLRYSKELAEDAARVAKEVDAFQRGAKLNANNLMVRQVIQTTQKLMMQEPKRFGERAGLIGFRGGMKPLELEEVLETIAANTVETQRLLTKEAFVARMAPEITKLKSEFPDMYRQWAIRFNSHLGYQGPVAKAIDGLVDKVLAPYFGSFAASRAVRKMNRGMFGLTLSAGDLGFLAVNSLTGIQTILPEAALLMRTPPSRLVKWYDFGMIGTSRGIQSASFLSPARMTWQGFKELAKLTDESDPALMAAVVRAREEGIISKPIITEIREFGEIASEHLKTKNPIEAIMRFNEDVIGRTEELSRAWAFVTGRKIAKEFLNQTDDQAFETARRFVSRTMYEYSAGDRARITTGAVGSGWGLFKNWTMHYVANLMAYADEAAWKGNWTPLMWSMIGTGSVGGAVAMPGFGAANAVADWLSNKDLVEWTYEAADYGGAGGHLVADGFNYGLPSLLGITFQGRASAPGASAIRDATLYANMAVLDRAQGLYRFFGSAIDQVADGNLLVLNDKRVQRGLMQAMAPRTLQRAYTYWGKEGLDSLKTGNRLINKVSATDVFLHTVGLTPIEIERTFDTAATLYEDANKLRARIQFFGEGYAQAQMGRDFEEQKRIIRRLHVEGLPLGSVLRSSAARIQNNQDDLLERQFDEILVRKAKRMRGF